MLRTFSCKVRIISRPVLSPMWQSRSWLWPPKARWEILPSEVRLKRAPHCSSSMTLSGASLAKISAIRQLLRNLPLFMVSMKCSCQLSSGSTFPTDAAMPPSAMTVWALPKSDLLTTPTESPRSLASIAALSPAPPAPIISTSCSLTSCRAEPFTLPSVSIASTPLKEPYLLREQEPLRVRHGPRHEQAYVQVRPPHRKQANPGPEHVMSGQAADPVMSPAAHVASRNAGVAIHPTSHKMPHGMAAEGVSREQDHVHQKKERPNADREPPL